MKRVAAVGFLLWVLAATTAPAQLLDVDWKLYGAASVSGQSFCFYDEKGITQQPDGHIRVWTKCIPQSELDGAFEKDPDKKIVEATAQKVARYYVPPIAKLQNLDANDAMVMTGYEEVADLAGIPPQSRIFYELNCRDRMLRELSIDLNINGQIGSKNKPGEWKFVSPEGNGASLLKLLCPL